MREDHAVGGFFNFDTIAGPTKLDRARAPFLTIRLCDTSESFANGHAGQPPLLNANRWRYCRFRW